MPVAGDAYRQWAWDGSPTVRNRLEEPVTAEWLAVQVADDLSEIQKAVSDVCCELVNLVQAGLVDVVEVRNE